MRSKIIIRRWLALCLVLLWISKQSPQIVLHAIISGHQHPQPPSHSPLKLEGLQQLFQCQYKDSPFQAQDTDLVEVRVDPRSAILKLQPATSVVVGYSCLFSLTSLRAPPAA